MLAELSGENWKENKIIRFSNLIHNLMNQTFTLTTLP